MLGYGLLGLIVLILDIVALVDLLKSAKPPEMKLLWTLLIILLPLIGMILYFVIGR